MDDIFQATVDGTKIGGSFTAMQDGTFQAVAVVGLASGSASDCRRIPSGTFFESREEAEEEGLNFARDIVLGNVPNPNLSGSN